MNDNPSQAAWLFRRGRRLGRLALDAHLRGAFTRAALLSHLRSAYFARWLSLVLERRHDDLAERRRRDAHRHIHTARTLARRAS